MKDITVEYKVKAFISSRCDSKYNIARKALKTLLEETNLVTAYIFESSGASSQDVVTSYLSKLDDSDVCIFLIDNKDDVSEGVIKEQKRARELGKKSIYLFCDENKKEPTQIQKELISYGKEKFYIVHDFSDFASLAYKCLIQDIVDIYRNYCKNLLIGKKYDEHGQDPVNTEVFDSYIVDKQIFKNLVLTKNYLRHLIYNSDYESTESTQFDILCQRLLSIIVGHDSGYEQYDFISLLQELKKQHTQQIFELIELRWNAIKKYFANDLDECINYLNKAYELSVSSDGVPTWIKTDILIDLRNMQNLQNETQNKYGLVAAQQLLNVSNWNVYFPLLDRLESGVNKDILTENFAFATRSPYTTVFNNVGHVFDDIVNIFAVAVYYGSLTHILRTRDRLSAVLCNLTTTFDSHTTYIELLSNLILSQDSKKVEAAMKAYNQTSEMINTEDAQYLYDISKVIPIRHQQFQSRLLTLEYFGLYFSDKQFSQIWAGLLIDINNWVVSGEKVISVWNYIFKALLSNLCRIDNNEVCGIISTIFENELKRFYDDCFEIVLHLDFSTMKTVTATALVKFLIRILRNCDERNNYHNLLSCIIHVRKTCSIKKEEFDRCVCDMSNEYFNTVYSLEVFSDQSEMSFQYIDKFVKDIVFQNTNQGVNGQYTGWGNNPFKTISNIISINNLKLNWISVKSIINAIECTVFSDRQTVAAKINAIHLLIFLHNHCTCPKKIEMIARKWIKGSDLIRNAYVMGFFEKDTMITLEFNIMLLKLCINSLEVNEAINALSAPDLLDDYEIIQSLKGLELLLLNSDISNMDQQIISVISQYVLRCSYHRERDIKYYSVKNSFCLVNSICKQSMIASVSRMMDSNDYFTKITILNNAGFLKTVDYNIYRLIVQKGRADNHYMVRKKANSIVI